MNTHPTPQPPASIDRREWTRRRVLLALTAAMSSSISGLLAACGSTQTATTTAAPQIRTANSTATTRVAAATSTASSTSAAARVTSTHATGAPITLQMSSASHGAGNTFATVMKNLSQAFTKLHPSIKIETQFITGNYHEKLTVAAAGGTAPDVIFFGAGKDMPSYMNLGFFLDLDPFVQRSSTTKAADFFPVDWQFVRWKGKQYGVPWGSGVAVIFYNKTLFDSSGVPYPPTAWNDPKWTWEAFLETATKLTKGTGASKIFGYSPNTWWVYVQPWIWANGGEGVLNANTYGVLGSPPRCLLEERVAYDAIQWIADLSLKHHVAPLASEMSEGLQNMLTGGRVAMWEANTGQVPFVSTYKDFHWDVAPYPRGQSGPHPRNPVDSITIWSKTKYPDHSWQVVEYATGTEGMKMLIAFGEDIPARISLAESAVFLRPNTPQHWKVFLDGVKLAREDPLTIIFPWMNTTINQEYNSSVLTGKETALHMGQHLVPLIDAKLKGA